MDEKRQKVHRASNVLENFIKSKKIDTQSDYGGPSTDNPYDTTSLPTDKNTQESERNILKLDSPTLKRKTDQFDSLSKKIKTLQDELSEKTERISALEIENDVLRKGNGDGIAVSQQDGPMIKDLQKMVDARDTFIKQLSDSLQKRSEELQASILRERELAEEIQNRQKHMSSMTKQTELKLSEVYSESVEYKAKVELMSNQIQEYSVLVQSLRATLENNNKEMIAKKEQLEKKEKKLEIYKTEVSEDVKTLMRQIETLNHELSKKEKEMVKNKNEVESIKSKMEEQFGTEIVALKAKLESKYAEDVKKVEALYDGMLLDHIRKSDHHLKAVKESSHLEEQIKAMREFYEKELNKYKEELHALLLKSKATEDKLTFELEKCKQEADHFRQQVENIENKVAEEVRKLQRECFKELDQYECEVKQEQNKYETEIQKLARRLREIAVSEATKEVELESYKNQLEKLQEYIETLEEKLNWCRDEYEREKSQLKSKITEFQDSECKLMNELRISRAKLLDYENRVIEYNENFKDQSNDFNEKHKNVIRAFEEQIQNLMKELERTKACYEADKSRFTSMINEKENHIKNLEAKLNYLNVMVTDKSNESNTLAESFSDQDSVQEIIEQINTLKNNLKQSEKFEESNRDFLFKALVELKQVKTLISRISGKDVEENAEETNDGNADISLVEELANTIKGIVNLTQSCQNASKPREVSASSRISNMFTSTPRVNATTDRFSDPSCIRNDPGNDLIRKCELLEAENIKLTGKLELLTAHLKEMEYCFYVASKESAIFDEKCKDLDSKITELETLKFSEFMLKKENNELKEKLMYIEESERNVRKELAEISEKNIELEKTLRKTLAELYEEVSNSNNGPNINLEAVLSDLKAKSEEVVRLRSQLSAVQNALKDNQEKMMHLKTKCDKFIAEHDFLMSEIKTKQKELEDVWKERNELSTENKMLQSKLVSVQGKSSLHFHKIPSSVRLSSTSTAENESPGSFVADKESEMRKLNMSETDDDFNDFHGKRLQTMHLLTESITMSSKTSMKESSSSLSVASRIDLELQQLDEMFDEPDNLYMPTITEEDEDFSDEVRVFFQSMAQGDQNKDGKEKKMLLPWLEEYETLDVTLLKDLDISINEKYLKIEKETQKEESPDNNSLTIQPPSENLSSQEFMRLLIEHCIRSLFFLKKRLINAHNAVLKTVRIQQAQLDRSCIVLELQEQIKTLESEKNLLEEKLQERIKTLDSEKHELEKKLQLQEQIQTSKTEKDKLEEKLQAQIKTLESEKNELKEKLQEQIEALESEKNELEEKLQEQIEALESEKNELEEKLQEQNKTLESEKDKLEEKLQAQIKTLESEINELEEKLQEQIEVLESEKNELEEKLQEQNKTLESEMDELVKKLQEQIKKLDSEKDELEKKHKSAMELLVKDNETELSVAKNWLTKLQNNNSVAVTEDVEAVRKDLEQKHRQEVEELRTYFEKKCADLEKHYSEEIYSQSQHNSKISMSSCSSDVGNIVELFDDEPPNHIESEDSLHKGCEKREVDLKELLGNMQEKYKVELESVKSDYELRLKDSVCKTCQKNLTNGEEPSVKQPGITLEQYYTEKIQDLGDKYPSTNVSKDLELKVYQIKEEVRKDYELELDKIREEIVSKELKRKDEEIKMIKSQLNEAHKVEIEKLWRRYEELANKEVENSVIRVKNEVILTQELEEKAKYIEQLKHDKKELLKKLNLMNEQKSKDYEQIKGDLQRAHKKEFENMKQAFEIELTTRIDTVMEEKTEMEKSFLNYKKLVEKLEEEVRNLRLEREDWQKNEHKKLLNATEEVRKEILGALELQIKAMVESGDEGEDKSSWPPELAALERQFTSRYQRQLAQLVEEHALEMAEMKAEYDAKLSRLVREYSLQQAEEMPVAMITTGDHEIDKVIRERDNLRNITLTLRRVVQELANYLTTCEDELNKSIVGHLVKLASPHNGNRSQVQITAMDSDSDSEPSPSPQRKVHFAPDVSHIVSLMDEDHLFDASDSLDVSVHFHTELETCLERLRDEAAALLGLSQGREALMPSTVEDRRMTSLTRQLIEEKKAKEEANRQLQELQELVSRYEKELNDVHKELVETKDRMIKEKVAAETEFSERQTEQRIQKLCHLQEKARAMLSERGECPTVWLGLIEELCCEGDTLLEDAWRERDELKSEVEAADKQLRSTRAFLEEQAVDREQERDEFTREITRLNELVRERDREWTSHRHFATEVEALDQQVKETTEQLKDVEEQKTHFEKEYKTAVDKIWTLREIIAELESQVSRHCEREAELERGLAAAQTELTTQARGHADTLQRLRDGCCDSECSDVQQEEVNAGSSGAIVRQIKAQLRTLAKSLDRQIKELEAVNIHVSSASLSSPSEDVSIRDQLEALRCLTPDAPSPSPASPTCPPLEEFELLGERLLRYWRAAETVIKKLRDRDMQIDLLRAQNEEMQTERDVLQGQSERALMQVASLTNKVEELRVRSDREISAATQPLTQRLLQLEQENKEFSDQLRESQRKLGKMKQKLERSESLIQSHEARIRSMSDHQHELVEKLTKDLETMRAEKQQLQAMVEKYRTEDNVSFPQLIEVMLAEKNADIDQLQQRVEELSQQDQSSKSQGSSKGRGLRVSFADNTAATQSQSQLGEGERARDVRHDHSSIRPIFSTPLSTIDDGGSRLVPRVIGEDLSKIPEPSEVHFTSSPNRANQLESVLTQLKTELEQKTQRLLECEVQLHELPLLQQKLDDAKEQLESLEEVKQLLAEREKELEEVRADLAQKEEDNVKTAADVKALQAIMEGLQQKLKEAKTFAEFYENNPTLDELREASNKYREECDSYKTTITGLESQLSELQKTLDDGKEVQETLKKTIAKLETDKQNILSDLVMTKSKCKSLQEELGTAVSSAKENSEKVVFLINALEESQKENDKLSDSCQRLKKDVEKLSRKQKIEMKNMLRKDSEEADKMKDELESLKTSNSELQAEKESLQQKLEEVGGRLRSLLEEANNKDDKLQQLENELKLLDENCKMLKNEKTATEQSLNNEIAILKILRDDLNQNLVSLETQCKELEENVPEKENIDSLRRKYESLKREYERQRRARRESEKKYAVLKNELMKEKEFSAHLKIKRDGSRVPRLAITKTNLVDIRGEGSTLSNSLDDLTDEVQKQLNASAKLDQTILSELQSKAETQGTQGGRSEVMPPRTDYLTARLAEVETALRVERVVVSELRARLAEERGRYLQERERVATLRDEVASLQTLNDQLEDKFRGIAYQLEQQVNGVKELMRAEPVDTGKEKELRRLLEESQRRVDELQQERGFNRNQLLYLREELAKARETRPSTTDREGVKQTVESARCELQQERSRSAMLQQMLDQANLNSERATAELQAKVDDMQNQLDIEVGLRKTLESKIKAMELAERSRHIRRKSCEEKLKEQLNQAEKAKRELERECMGLQLKLKQSHLQITAHTDESPLALRLREANVTVERLVGEKEDLLAANTVLKEEKEDLLKKRRELEEVIEDLKSQINALNIKVVDGGVDNLNAMFAAERAAWLREKEALKKAVARSQSHVGSGSDSFNGYANSTHLLQKFLRAESHRKALVWQKRYLLVSLSGYQAEERRTVAALYRFPAPSPPPPPTAEHRFRVAVCTVRAVFRMQFLVNHRRRAYDNTRRVLQRALDSARSGPYTAENIPELQTLWRRNNVPSSSQHLQPGSIAQYIDRFNTLQDRIKNALSTSS